MGNLNDENLISTLEHSLRQFQAAELRLQERLRKIQDEAEDLKIEITALQNSAEKTEEALHSLIPKMRSGSKSWKAHKKLHEEADYQKKSRYDDDEELYQKKSRYEDEDDYPRRPRFEGEYPMPPRRYKNPKDVDQPQQNHRTNSVAYLNNNQHNIPSINPKSEAVNRRFADRTITQACTLLLRESNSALHVNDLYNLLVEGGFEFKGNNPTISIAVSLNRNRRFSKVAPGTFDLVMRDASSKAAS